MIQVELLIDVVDMVADRLRRDGVLSGDFLGPAAPGNADHDVALTWAERRDDSGDWPRLLHRPDDPSHEIRIEIPSRRPQADQGLFESLARRNSREVAVSAHPDGLQENRRIIFRIEQQQETSGPAWILERPR